MENLQVLFRIDFKASKSFRASNKKGTVDNSYINKQILDKFVQIILMKVRKAQKCGY